MSKIIKKLQKISESAAPQIGFKISASSPGRKMLLIAALNPGNVGKVQQLTEVDVDAVLIHSKDVGKKLLHQDMAGSMGDIPWGVWSDKLGKEEVEGLKESGSDLLIFTASEAPATLLQEEIGKVVKMTIPYEEGLVKTVNQLQIDAILLDFGKEGRNLTVSHLMNCQWLASSVNKPLLAGVQQGLSEKDILALYEVGVKGVVVDMEEEPQSELTRLRQAISALPKTTKKPGERGVMLPHMEAKEDSLLSEDI